MVCRKALGAYSRIAEHRFVMRLIAARRSGSLSDVSCLTWTATAEQSSPLRNRSSTWELMAVGQMG